MTFTISEDDFKMYASNILRHFPEAFMALGAIDVGESYEPRSSGRWRTKIEDTPSGKSVEIFVPRRNINKSDHKEDDEEDDDEDEDDEALDEDEDDEDEDEDPPLPVTTSSTRAADGNEAPESNPSKRQKNCSDDSRVREDPIERLHREVLHSVRQRVSKVSEQIQTHELRDEPAWRDELTRASSELDNLPLRPDDVEGRRLRRSILDEITEVERRIDQRVQAMKEDILECLRRVEILEGHIARNDRSYTITQLRAGIDLVQGQLDALQCSGAEARDWRKKLVARLKAVDEWLHRHASS